MLQGFAYVGESEVSILCKYFSLNGNLFDIFGKKAQGAVAGNFEPKSSRGELTFYLSSICILRKAQTHSVFLAHYNMLSLKAADLITFFFFLKRRPHSY